MKIIKISEYDPVALETAKTEAIKALRHLQKKVNDQHAKADEIPKFISDLRDFIHELEDMS